MKDKLQGISFFVWFVSGGWVVLGSPGKGLTAAVSGEKLSWSCGEMVVGSNISSPQGHFHF